MMGRVDSLIATGNTMARSLVEDFSMSELVCLVSGVVMSRLLFRFCIELGGQLPTVCDTILKRLWGTLRAGAY